MKEIFRMRHGSHAFGTNTPLSDIDTKAVHIPHVRDIILAQAPNVNVVLPEKELGAKNKPGDQDFSSFSVHKLFEMLVDGDIIGMEILFAPPSAIELHTIEWGFIQHQRHLFLSRNFGGYVDYCRRQANKYGLRGSRVNTAQAIVKLLQPYVIHSPRDKLGTLSMTLAMFVDEHPAHAQIIEKPEKSTGKMTKYLEICDKQVVFNNSIKDAYAVFSKLMDRYGDRALQAAANKGVDWKALSHAVRVGNQAIELLKTGHITFPRPEAAYLVAIKQGRVLYKTLEVELDELLNKVVEASAESTLPMEIDLEKIKDLQFKLYHDYIIENAK